MKKSKIAFNFFIIILTILLITITVTSYIFTHLFLKHLEKEHIKFFDMTLSQTASNIDYFLEQQLITISNTVMNDAVINVLMLPDFNAPSDEYKANQTLIEKSNINDTFMEKIEGYGAIYQLDKYSPTTKKNYILYKWLSYGAYPDFKDLKKDPLYKDMINHKKPVFGLLDNNILKNYKNPALLYPFIENDNFEAFMLVFLQKDAIANSFIEITEIGKGTLFILDRFNNVITQNHNGKHDYYEFDSENNQYIFNDEIDEKTDPFTGLTFNDYKKLITDKSILNNSHIKNILDTQKPDDTNDNKIIKWNNIDYIFSAKASKNLGINLVYIQPMIFIHRPVYRTMYIILTITFIIFIIIAIISFITSRFFAKPIDAENKYLTERTQKLKELDELKNDFIANITHDFRSPLTVILNKSDILLKTQELNEDVQRGIKTIISASYQLKSSIDKLLDLARMDSNGVNLKISKINPNDFLSSITDFYKSVVSHNNIKIIEKIPATNIDNFFSDREKLEQIINNIFSNALKFIDPDNGIIEISLQVTEEAVIFKIKDNGIGIEKESLNRIFEKFYQVQSSQNNKYKGTGIGLAFSYQLVHYLHGKISAQSDGNGKGAEFIVELPRGKDLYDKKLFTNTCIRHSDRKEIKNLIRENIIYKKNENQIREFSGKKNKHGEFDFQKGMILVIEDNEHIQNIIIEYLMLGGYKNIVIASNGKIGLDNIYHEKPDMIICDYNMPELKGDQLQEIIANNPNFNQIPFIFLSAVTNKATIIESKEKGAVAYLTKPIDEKELLINVEIHLKKYMEYKKTLKLATYDELTEVLNRRAVLNRLQSLLSVREYRNISLIFIDIDHFKLFNDQYGHQIGDEVLTQTGKTLNRLLRKYDVAGRYGGEEFLILLPDTSLEDAFKVADKIHKKIEHTTVYSAEHKKKLKISVSIGLSSLKEYSQYIEKQLKIDNLETLFSNGNITDHSIIPPYKERLQHLLVQMADTALYKAKSTICNNCKFSSLKPEDFINDSCSKCKSNNITHGRNKTVSFDSDNN